MMALVLLVDHATSPGFSLSTIEQLWPWLGVIPITYLVARTGAAKELRSIQAETIETWESRAEGLERDLKDARAEIAELHRKTDRMDADHRRALAQAEMRVEHAMGELESARRELSIVRAARDEALRRLGAAEAELLEAQGHITALRTQLGQ